MRVHTRAYRKMLLHALRFPSRPVLGVLIGVRKQGEAEPEIVDVAPLFHSYALAPMLELALSLVELHCKVGIRGARLRANPTHAFVSVHPEKPASRGRGLLRGQ